MLVDAVDRKRLPRLPLSHVTTVLGHHEVFRVGTLPNQLMRITFSGARFSRGTNNNVALNWGTAKKTPYFSYFPLL